MDHESGRWLCGVSTGLGVMGCARQMGWRTCSNGSRKRAVDIARIRQMLRRFMTRMIVSKELVTEARLRSTGYE